MHLMLRSIELEFFLHDVELSRCIILALNTGMTLFEGVRASKKMWKLVKSAFIIIQNLIK